VLADVELVDRLRAGDEDAFVTLVERYHAPLVRLAATFVPNRAVAEEVVQETWLGVVRGIDRFEGRSSLKTWVFRILVNRARTAGARARRETPADFGAEPAVPASRFAATGHWADPPAAWADDADARLDAVGAAEHVRRFVEELPDGQRQVVLLRDVEGLPAEEVCALLGITAGNQRVLLHRGRSRVRRMIESEMGSD
jgi:RNA polymerase sigma-70 factor, ECF subfamily